MFRKRGNFTSVKEVVLANTGLSEETFLHPDPEPEIYNLDRAANLIKDIVRKNPDVSIQIAGDYDSDGIIATTIMTFGLRYCGARNIKCRIPRRFTEGYGLSEHIIEEIIDEMADEGTEAGLIITVDNGIAASEAIQLAKEHGFTVIVTDHHLAPTDGEGNRILPPADVIVDPAAEDVTEYKHYCGAGLAYRLARLLNNGAKMPQLAAFAAIATITDVVNVTGANRLLVQNGLKAINERRVLPGLEAILDVFEFDNHVTETDIGFRIGPMLNASSRMADEGADDVLDVVSSMNTPSLRFKAKMLKETNEARKEESAKQYAVAEQLIGNDRPIVICNEAFTPGIIGIIAGRLAERYHCPAIVLSVNDDGMLKGSGRTIPEVHMKNALDKCRTYLDGYGGHAGAAGLSLKPENLDGFKTAFKKSLPAVTQIRRIENVRFGDYGRTDSICRE